MSKLDRNSNSPIDEFDLRFEDTEDEITEEEVKREVERNKSQNYESVTLNKTKNNNSNKTKIIACIAAVSAVAIVTVGTFTYSKIKKNKELALAQQQAEANSKLEENTSTSKEDTKAGMPNLYGNTKSENDSEVSESSKITENLNGESINPNYTIKEIKTVTDFINFEKFRAVTDSGMEFYWLETTYKDKKYKVQVPFSIYKELDNKGITVVDVEVTILQDNSQVVTYMNVRKDAKTLIEKNSQKSK